MAEERDEDFMKSTRNGITIADKLDYGPTLNRLERVFYFKGPSGGRGEMSIRELPDGAMQVYLFNLSTDTMIVCSDSHHITTR
jgi:hypothetical protein